MAYESTKKGNNSAPKTKSGSTITFYACLDYTRTETNTQVKLAYQPRLESSGQPYSKGKLTGTGQTTVSLGTEKPATSGAGYSWAKGTWTWNKGTSGATKTVTLKLGPTATATAYDDAISTASISVSVPALTSHKVTYNANGGSGAPASQTKYYGKAITLSSSKPKRTGYTFVKWNTAAAGTGTSYAPGASYTANGTTDVTLYAVWQPVTYTIAYNANGGSGAPASQAKTYAQALTLSSAKPTRTGYTFAGWGTSDSASTVTYASGGSYTANAAATLYAVWKPVISATLTLSERCSDAACTAEDEEGAYLKATVSWSCAVSVTSSSLAAKSGSGLTVGEYSFTAGKTGSYSAVISGFQADKTYPITATFGTSAANGIATASLAVVKSSSGAVYMLDFKGDSGVGIMCAAPDSGMDVNGDITVRGGHGDIILTAQADYVAVPTDAYYGPNIAVKDVNGKQVSYTQVSRTPTGVYRSLGVTNPKTGKAAALYITADDNGTGRITASSGHSVQVSAGGSGQTGSTSNTTASQILTAGSGVTITSAQYAQWGKVATLYLKFKYSSAISSGNITNITLGTLVSGKRPEVPSPFALASTGPVMNGYITTGGNIVLAATAGAISANAEVDIAATYVLA